MKINIAFAPGRPSRQYDTNLEVKPTDLIGSPQLVGRFLGHDAEGFEWRQMMDVVDTGTTLVNVEGRAYTIESMDQQLNFRLKGG
jgi:hypothetical protein